CSSCHCRAMRPSAEPGALRFQGAEASISMEGRMDHAWRAQHTTRRAFGLSFGAGLFVLAVPGASRAALKKVPMSTGIDAIFAPFVVAAGRQMFEKYDLEASLQPVDDGNIALDAILTGSSDIGSTTEFGGLARWDKGGKLYVTSYSVTSRKQIGIASRGEIGKPADLIGRTVGYPRASGGHLYFLNYVEKNKLPVDKINVKKKQAPQMGAGPPRRALEAFFLLAAWAPQARD